MADDGDGLEVLDLGLIDDPDADVDRGWHDVPGVAVTRRRLIALGGVLAAAGALDALRTSHSPNSAELATATPVRSTGPVTTRALAPPPLAVIEHGHPLLGGPALDVFGLADSSVVRIELAIGRVTETLLGPLGHVDMSLVPVRGGVVVHPGDERPGYLVPDGRAATPTPRALDGPGRMLPGPDPDHVWVHVRDGDPGRMVLTALDGRTTGTSVAVPTYSRFGLMADGGGYPLFGAVGGFYRGEPRGPQRVTNGIVVACGPSGWLAVEWDDRDRCAAVVVDRRGRRREVPGVANPRVPAGVLAPDGRTAAVYVVGPPTTLTLTLLDLGSGKRRTVGMTVGEGQDVSSLAWSPDGRWLFAVDASAHVFAVDPRTSRAAMLVAGLPTIRQIAVRTA